MARRITALLLLALVGSCGDTPAESPSETAAQKRPSRISVVRTSEGSSPLQPRIRLERPDRSLISVQFDHATYSHVRESATAELAEPVTTQLVANPKTRATQGLKLVSVQTDSLLDRLDLRAGDILTSLAGAPITSSEGLVALLEALKRQEQFELGLTRRGRATIYRIDARDPQLRRGGVNPNAKNR